MSKPSNSLTRTIPTQLLGDAVIHLMQVADESVCALRDIINSSGRCGVCGRYKDPRPIIQSASAVLRTVFGKEARVLRAMARTEPNTIWVASLTNDERVMLGSAQAVIAELQHRALARQTAKPGPQAALPSPSNVDFEVGPDEPDEVEL